jgi:predicted  nucleic acid-binding Zn-ribbon protein
MYEVIDRKLAALKAELERGNTMISQKQQEMLALQTTIFRIQGAITALEELKKEPF